jgi:hypothetical protein
MRLCIVLGYSHNEIVYGAGYSHIGTRGWGYLEVGPGVGTIWVNNTSLNTISISSYTRYVTYVGAPKKTVPVSGGSCQIKVTSG